MDGLRVNRDLSSMKRVVSKDDAFRWETNSAPGKSLPTQHPGVEVELDARRLQGCGT
jgi:hypothetical protein